MLLSLAGPTLVGMVNLLILVFGFPFSGTMTDLWDPGQVREYKQSEFWTGLFGHEVDALWREYLRTLKKDDDGRS